VICGALTPNSVETTARHPGNSAIMSCRRGCLFGRSTRSISEASTGRRRTCTTRLRIPTANMLCERRQYRDDASSGGDGEGAPATGGWPNLISQACSFARESIFSGAGAPFSAMARNAATEGSGRQQYQ
jgi:hypothetical protein